MCQQANSVITKDKETKNAINIKKPKKETYRYAMRYLMPIN
jgi:hypothetical protein